MVYNTINMRIILVYIFLSFSLISFGQKPILKLLFDNEIVDSSGTGTLGSTSGNVTYSSSIKYQGTHSFYPLYQGQWKSTSALNLTNSFSVSLWFRSSITGTASLIGNIAASNTNGWHMRLDGSNNSVYLYTRNSTTIDVVQTNGTDWTDNTLTNVVVLVDEANSKARIYINKVFQTPLSNDSIIRNDFDANQILTVNGYRDAAQHFNENGYIDNLQVYDYILTQAQIDSLYDLGATSFQLGSYVPPAPEVQVLTYYRQNTNNKNWINILNSKRAYLIDIVTDSTIYDLDSITYILANNFDAFTPGPVPLDTLMNHIQVWKSNYYAPNQSITVDPVTNSKVFKMVIKAGEDYRRSCEIFFPLDRGYDELWLDYDLTTSFPFNTQGQGGSSFHSGKIPMGYYGGLNFNSAIKDSAAYSATSSAWWAHWVFGTTSLMHYSYDLNVNSETGLAVCPVSYNGKRHISVRYKVSTPGQANGFVERYIDGVFVNGKYNIKMRSVAQGSNYGKAEGIKSAFFFGGGSVDFAPTSDHYATVDNLVVSVANYGTRKITGYSPAGHRIGSVSHADLNVPDILRNEAFTASSGAIQSHYNIETPPMSKQVYTKTIVRPSGTILLEFDYFRKTTANDGDGMYMLVYSGTGGGKALVATYNYSNLPPSSIVISASSCTIEYYMGTNYEHIRGWKLHYTNLP